MGSGLLEKERRYVQNMWELWMSRGPTSTLTQKQMAAQYSNINKRKLLSQLEIERLQCNGNTIKQYGDAALALVKDCFFKGLDDNPVMTPSSTELKIKIVGVQSYQPYTEHHSAVSEEEPVASMIISKKLWFLGNGKPLMHRDNGLMDLMFNQC